MRASELFKPIAAYQIDHGIKVTNKQISEATGIPQGRIRVLKEFPERATWGELELLATIYKFSLTIGG